MFTGLVTDVGRIASLEDRPGLRRLRVESDYPIAALQPGASVMHDGVCLTLVEFGARDEGSWWVVEAIPETLNRTTLGGLKADDWVNLELSLKMGDELGGHLVSGHIDGVGDVLSVTEEGESWRIRIGMPPDLARFLAQKGSIAVDGVSLTVAAVGGEVAAPWFEVTIIPHTLIVTTLGEAAPGQKVNLEVDLIARYVARMLEFKGQ
jgi:riboflavin synthase